MDEVLQKAITNLSNRLGQAEANLAIAHAQVDVLQAMLAEKEAQLAAKNESTEQK